jgi:hypothetical protein
MKKLLSLVALVGIMASCNNKKDEKKEDVKTDTAVTTTTTDPAPPSDVTPAGDVPKFADADVQAYADAYAAYAEAYKKAAESKDMTKFQDLTKQGQDLAAKATAMSQKLSTSPEEAKKLSDFIMAKSNEIMEYTKKLTGQ